MGISRLSVRIVILLLLIGGSTLTYFLANQEKFKPNDEFYVQYDDEDIKDLQLNYRIDQLNGYTLRQVFEESTIYSVGKNLFDTQQTLTAGRLNAGTPTPVTNGSIVSKLSNSITFTSVVNFHGFATDFIPVIPNQSYIFSFTAVSGLMLRRVQAYDINKNYIGEIADTTNITTFTTTNAHYIRMSFIANTAGTYTVDNPQLEQGTVATPYVSYKSSLNGDLPPFVYWYNLDTLDIDKLTLEEMNQYYQMYLDISDGQRIINEPLAKLDSKGRDYYHVSMDDYEMLGNSGVVDFKQLLAEDGPISTVSKVMEGVSGFFRYTIDKIDDFIQGYLNIMQNIKKFITGWFS